MTRPLTRGSWSQSVPVTSRCGPVPELWTRGRVDHALRFRATVLPEQVVSLERGEHVDAAITCVRSVQSRGGQAGVVVPRAVPGEVQRPLRSNSAPVSLNPCTAACTTVPALHHPRSSRITHLACSSHTCSALRRTWPNCRENVSSISSAWRLAPRPGYPASHPCRARAWPRDDHVPRYAVIVTDEHKPLDRQIRVPPCPRTSKLPSHMVIRNSGTPRYRSGQPCCCSTPWDTCSKVFPQATQTRLHCSLHHSQNHARCSHRALAAAG